MQQHFSQGSGVANAHHAAPAAAAYVYCRLVCNLLHNILRSGVIILHTVAHRCFHEACSPAPVWCCCWRG
jgi:hypothetical protein